MSTTDAAVNAISRLATTGMVAGVALKVTDITLRQVNRFGKKPCKHTKRKKRKR